MSLHHPHRQPRAYRINPVGVLLSFGKGHAQAWRGRAGQGKGQAKKTKEDQMAKVFLGGIPSDVDVERLHKAFGAPPYAEIDTVQGITRGNHRWRSVVGAWRQ